MKKNERRYRQTIRIEGKGIDDLFRLPCVVSIVKCSFPDALGPFSLFLNDYRTNVYVGDTLCEDYDGRWYAVRDGETKEIIKPE